MTFFTKLKRAWSQFYEGANTTNTQRTYIYPQSVDTRMTLNPGVRRDMVGISRYLAENIGIVRGIYRDVALYSSIGKPQLQWENRTQAEEAEAAIAEWAKIPEVTGKLDWSQLQNLLNFSADRDGDIGYIFTDNPFPQLQVIESHRIDSALEEGWQDGVKVSKDGRPTAYRVLTGDAMDWNSYRDIPAAAFGLFYEPSRADQLRGIPSLVHGLNASRDIHDIVGFLKQTLKVESLHAIIKTTESGFADTNDWNTSDNTSTATTDAILERLYGGLMPRLKVGEKIESFATDRPSPNVQTFIEYLIRDIACGMGLPFEFVWNPQALSGPAMRFVMAKAQRRIAQRQSLLEKHSRRIHGWVLAKLAKRGDISPLPADWYRITYQRPADLTIDVGREQAQDRADFQAGLITPQEFYAKQGVDMDDHLTQRVAWAKRLQEASVRENIPMWLLYMPTPNGVPAQQEKQEQDSADSTTNTNA